MTGRLPGYDWRRSYEWNYDHAPAPPSVEVPVVDGQWDYCGLPVNSPLGIPAGPLLNGSWCLYYAGLGFDVLTYKTVRSKSRKCYGMPNLQPVDCGPLSGGGTSVTATHEMQESWAVSFGMPSQPPEIWRADVEETRRQLPAGKLLAVSVVGTTQPDWSIEQLAKDYALCAKWAVESGADVVETNFSCPNVSTCDGQLYQVPEQARIVAAHVREQIGKTPYLIKIGHIAEDDRILELIKALDGLADGLAMTNSIAATVRHEDETPIFGGESRGICGAAILQESIRQVSRFSRLVAAQNSLLRLVGVGGVRCGEDVIEYCRAGATAVQIATAAMLNPRIGLEIRETLASRPMTTL